MNTAPGACSDLQTDQHLLPEVAGVVQRAVRQLWAGALQRHTSAALESPGVGALSDRGVNKSAMNVATVGTNP